MTRDEYRAWIRDYASGIGLDPAIAESVWKQESGGSLDTSLKGPELSRGRGNAIGPWQVVPAYHPEFPVNGDPVAQGQYAMNYLKEVGPAGYYGTGQAPQGQPTTDQYVSQVMRRAGRPDARMAAATAGTTTDTDRTPAGDPRTGMMLPEQQIPTLPPFLMQQQQQAQPESGMNPLINPIMSLIMGAAMSRGNIGQRLTAGAGLAGAGLQAADLAENELLDLKMKREASKRRMQSQDAIDRYADQLMADPATQEIGAIIKADPGAGMQYLAKMRMEQQAAQQRQALAQQFRDRGDERGALMIEAGYSPGQEQGGAPKHGVSPQYIQENGKWYAYQFAEDGTHIKTEVPGPPIVYDPAQRQSVATGIATGTGLGKAAADSITGMPEAMATIDQSIKVIDDLLAHPGREMATGMSSVLPRIAGMSPKDYELKLGMIKGAAFLQAFEALKGGGHITEVEGMKATAAITDLDLAQSEEEHEKALKNLRSLLENARIRAMRKAGQQVPQQPSHGSPSQPPRQQAMPKGVMIERMGD